MLFVKGMRYLTKHLEALKRHFCTASIPTRKLGWKKIYTLHIFFYFLKLVPDLKERWDKFKIIFKRKKATKKAGLE